MPSMLIVMSISHPRLRSFSLKRSLKTPAALAARVGVVHYIITVHAIALGRAMALRSHSTDS